MVKIVNKLYLEEKEISTGEKGREMTTPRVR